MTATASGSTKPGYSPQPVCLQNHNCCTCQVEEVRLLVKFVEHSARSVFDICSSQDGNAIFGKFSCKLRSALSILEGCDARGDCKAGDVNRMSSKLQNQQPYVHQVLANGDGSHERVGQIVARQQKLMRMIDVNTHVIS